jgi:hypothetical protein
MNGPRYLPGNDEDEDVQSVIIYEDFLATMSPRARDPVARRLQVRCPPRLRT